MKKPATINLVIFGAGGNSLAIVDAIEAINALEQAAASAPRYRIIGFLDDLSENRGGSLLGYPVIGTIIDAPKQSNCSFVNGISSVNSFRKIPEIIARSNIPPERFETIIHPDAIVSAHSIVGRGSAILAGSVVCPKATIGNHVIILQKTTVNHHSRIGDHCTLSAGITVLGCVDVGDNAFIGGASSIAPFVKIGPGALIGMGSVVIRDVAAGAVVAGNPARKLSASRHTG